MVSKTEYIINITSVFNVCNAYKVKTYMVDKVKRRYKVIDLHGTIYDKHVKIQMIKLPPTQTPLVAAT